MGNFNKGKKFNERGGNRNFGGRNFGDSRGGNRGFGGGRDGGKREMHKATCSDCNKNCEVPFRPTGDKPVFCSDCFKNKEDNNSRNFRGGGDNRGFDKRNSQPRFDDNRNTENYKAQFEQLNIKLDSILKILIPASSEGGDVSKSKKFQKTPKKETDTAALKDMIEKTIDKKTPTKKTVAKKTITKKKATEKKTKTATKKKKK